jgi:hypothetical protein
LAAGPSESKEITMSKKKAKKRSSRVKRVRQRAPIVAKRGIRPGLRGIATVVLGGLNESDDSVTHVTDKDGKKLPDDTDTSVNQDHYVA